MSRSTRLKILVSYVYFDNCRAWLEAQDPTSFDLLIDSGAFTAWTKGLPIDLPEYVRFLASLDSAWDWRAVQLDVIGNPEATGRNLEIMIDAGIPDIIPVFTRGEDIERLDYLHSLESDMVMIGGIGKGSQRRGYIKYFCEQNRGRPAHWLGFTEISFIQKYRPKSVDSSSYASAQMWGDLPLYIGNGRIRKLKSKMFHVKPPHDIVEDLMRLGLSMAEIRALGRKAAWQGTATDQFTPQHPRGMVSFLGYLAHVMVGREIEKTCGTDYFYACVTEANPIGIAAATRWIDEGRTDYFERIS
jgi:hypothetical protein